MNARIFKKQCKQAVAELIAKHGFKPDQFAKSEAGETWGYLNRFARKFPPHQRFHYKFMGRHKDDHIRLAKGTPMHWYRSSY